MPGGINNTTIVLIPKIKNPQSIKDFRPIVLCIVIYKIISRCLVNMLRPLLDGMISPTQSAFILGRLISDNALIAFECMQSLSTLKDLRRNIVLISWTLPNPMIVCIGNFSNV